MMKIVRPCHYTPDIRAIAEKLGVGNVLEGSVRKAGNELRVTARLIKAEVEFRGWAVLD